MFVEDRFVKVATYGTPDEIPVLAGILPAAYLKYGQELNALTARYPAIFDERAMNYDFDRDCPRSYRVGRFTDAWGCVWHNECEGMEAYVRGHPIPRREDIRNYQPPDADAAGLPHGFMYLRLLDLRGFEEAMIDFAEEPEELDLLLDLIADINVHQARRRCAQSEGRMIFFGDDLGMQDGLAMGALKWRKHMKPRFTRIYDVCREAGRLVYMHTDGQIYEIIPDLFEAGVDIVNPQFRANGLANLARVCKGRYPVCLDLDRQLFPFATTAELKDHVEEAVTTLWLKEGGLALNVELGPEVSLGNMAAILDAVDRMRLYCG